MLDSMKGLRRTHYCGEVLEESKDVIVGAIIGILSGVIGFYII